MLRSPAAAAPAVLFSLALMAAAAHAAPFNVNLAPSPDDFVHAREYRNLSGATSYTESVSFTAPAGVVNPGDTVSIRLALPQPIAVEQFYPGEDYFLDIALYRGPRISGQNQSLAADLALLDPAGLSTQTFDGAGYLSPIEGSTVEYDAAAILTPTGPAGSIGGVEWTFTAPNWTPPNTPMQLDFAVSFSTRRISTLPALIEPDHDLITFIPEPTSLALLTLPALAALTRPRRR